MHRPILLLSASALLFAGCASGPFNRYGNHGPDRTGLGRKLVVDKRPKSMLVAYDQTICIVDENRYLQVRVRDDVWCNWRREGGSGDTPAVAGDFGPAESGPVTGRTAKPVSTTVRPEGAAAKPASKAPKRPTPDRPAIRRD